MRDYKDGLKYNGYSQEEAYFHKHNQELIKKMKRSHLRLVVDNTKKIDPSSAAQAEFTPVADGHSKRKAA